MGQRACDIRLDLEEVLAKASPSLRKKIQYSVDLIRRSEKMALRLDPENGFYNTFSGGKDSQVLYYLMKLAGVKAKTHMNLTSVDPPEVIRFVREQYPDVELIKPKMSIYEMAKKKHILPTMRLRWCCAEFKEAYGAGKVTLIGIRHEESARRAKRQEVSADIKGGAHERIVRPMERTRGADGGVRRRKRQNTRFAYPALDGTGRVAVSQY